METEQETYKRLTKTALLAMKAEALGIDVLLAKMETADDYEALLDEVELLADRIARAKHLAVKDCENRDCTTVWPAPVWL